MNLRPLAPQASIITKLDDGPADGGYQGKLLNRWVDGGAMDGGGNSGMSTCSVCGRLSASGGDHLDCGEMRRARLEDEGREAAARHEVFAAGGGGGADDELAVEVRAILDHIGGGGGGHGTPRGGGGRPC